MPETMSPREKVAEQTIGPVSYDRLRSIIHSATHAALPFAEAPMTIPFSTQERAALQVEIADLILADLDKATAPTAALASSGDHAELARLAEEAIAQKGRWDEIYHINLFNAAANPATVLALIAEVAALREDLNRKHEACQIAQDQAMENGSRAREAERKLAEAKELMRAMLPEFPRDPINGSLPTFEQCEAVRTFLSKEAERG